MTYVRKNKGVCSSTTTVVLSDADIIEQIKVDDGCDGSLSGICSLVQGMTAQDAIARLRGIRCGHKATSCPDQISICLQEALEKKA